MNAQKLASYTAVLLVVGGFGLLGSMAGIRVAFAVVVNNVDCAASVPVGGPTGCQQALIQLNELTKILFAGGLFSMAMGGIGLWQLNNVDDE